MLIHIGYQTLQATGIAFNVIIIRTSPSRDEQFTVFADNAPSATEDGAPTRLRFHSHITELPAELPADIDDGEFTVKSIRASFVGPYKDLQININTNNIRDETEPESC
jgi:hypothetical protein